MPELAWHKSTYSAEAANCVEIASTPTIIHIRDSKHAEGPHLTVTSSTWSTFVSYAVSPESSPRR
ncbi:DUF397 domain-containing protein [Streptomyces sp. KR55]|uniref:DUF397 domain-containing protein n=1 Tax=Streptomyces sp. KR55 TaxID=3457425 RepID=UPI003FD03687